MSKSDLEKLFEECRKCEKCGLRNAHTRKNVVAGDGSEKANVMFVGEAPGENENLYGKPFLGFAGKRLDERLKDMELSRKDIYITNIVKCRPTKINSSTKKEENTPPKKEEQNACFSWLQREIELLRPKIIVCLGNVAARQLIDEKFKVSKMHGKFKEKEVIPNFKTSMMGTYHPRRFSDQKSTVKKDFEKLRKKMEDLNI
jgi:DNA polymerase